jgi:hypothetical protein
LKFFSFSICIPFCTYNRACHILDTQEMCLITPIKKSFTHQCFMDVNVLSFLLLAFFSQIDLEFMILQGQQVCTTTPSSMLVLYVLIQRSNIFFGSTQSIIMYYAHYCSGHKKQDFLKSFLVQFTFWPIIKMHRYEKLTQNTEK